jgi:RimJ/RimL family protein N-acetyltransferase
MIRSGPAEIVRGRVRLREITLDDVADLYRWRMNPDAREMFVDSAPLPFPAHEAFIAAYFSDQNEDRWFIIEVDRNAVGTLALYGFSEDGQSAEWGRFIVDPSHRRRGWGTAALGLLIEHACDLGVRRLRCIVLAGNTAAARTYERFGFREVGLHERGGRQFLELVSDLGRSRL